MPQGWRHDGGSRGGYAQLRAFPRPDANQVAVYPWRHVGDEQDLHRAEHGLPPAHLRGKVFAIRHGPARQSRTVSRAHPQHQAAAPGNKRPTQHRTEKFILQHRLDHGQHVYGHTGRVWRTQHAVGCRDGDDRGLLRTGTGRTAPADHHAPAHGRLRTRY